MPDNPKVATAEDRLNEMIWGAQIARHLVVLMEDELEHLTTNRDLRERVYNFAAHLFAPLAFSEDDSLYGDAEAKRAFLRAASIAYDKVFEDPEYKLRGALN